MTWSLSSTVEQDVSQAARELGPARRFFLQEFVPRETLNEKVRERAAFLPEKWAQSGKG